MAKSVLFIVLLQPLLWLVYDILSGVVIDPIETVTNSTGQWSLRFLLLTLAISPISRLTGYSLIRFRRMLGLFVFFYALLHFLIWLINQQFTWHLILEDVMKRGYITVGFIAFVSLFLLALTSNRFAIKQLRKKWQTLHRLIYVIVILVVIHFYWQAKSSMDIEPMVYASIAFFLLLLRLPYFKKRWQR